MKNYGQTTKILPTSCLEVDGFNVRVLRRLYKIAPFSLKGDYNQNKSPSPKPLMSCLICASNRPKALNDLLEDLSGQDLESDKFEVVILNDGGGESIRAVVNLFTAKLPIAYRENAASKKMIGLLRNSTLEMSCGEYILFLDDDTRILQSDFLRKGLDLFNKQNPDIIIPFGEALYGIVKLKYSYFDHYSFGCAGCLYKRGILEEVGGFNGNIPAYEDIEMGIRMFIQGVAIIKTDELVYFHPPFYFDSMQKPLSIGKSVLKLRRHYSFLVWLAVFLNALRFLPCGLVPDLRYQQWFKISLGVLLACFKKEEYYY
ncbi:MAG TPA: glycosyltransferase family A protein [Candidatus Omnitrophota bacterium]|nr:glycosyltransferase family A protein [Candidatus Omnitrophota bacterium]HPD85242.1 glycosyltransferase family A protein [Candidatus Omnitrophota bacterium]HRZ04257.1 glycosyltransferase family A protein [Candidatus Omnitrophota bacterium]